MEVLVLHKLDFNGVFSSSYSYIASLLTISQSPMDHHGSILFFADFFCAVLKRSFQPSTLGLPLFAVSYLTVIVSEALR